MWSEKVLNYRVWSYLFVKSNHKISTIELTAMFYGESESISTFSMWRELKELWQNNCVASLKPLISEASQKREHQDWPLEQWNNVMWSEVMHPSCLVPTRQACGGSVMIWVFFLTLRHNPRELMLLLFLAPSLHFRQFSLVHCSFFPRPCTHVPVLLVGYVHAQCVSGTLASSSWCTCVQ